MIAISDILANLPDKYRHYENLYGDEYWVIPAVVWWLRPKVIVELGTDKLTSAKMIVGTMDNATTFFTIDILPECRETVQKSGIKAIAITGDSREVGSKWELPVDLLYIDARHEYENVLGELTVWATKVTKCILLHDIFVCPPVRQAIMKWLEDPKNKEDWDYQEFVSHCGMGILWRK